MGPDDRRAESPQPGGATSTSRSLLAGLRADAAGAWDRLVSLYEPLVHHWCRRLGLPPQDIPDVSQDVFTTVSENLHRFRKARPGDTFRGWLRTITRRKAADYYRRRGSQPRGAGGTSAQARLAGLPAAAVAEDPEEAEIVRDALLQRALALIRDEFRGRTWDAFWRVVVDGQATREVAESLSMSPGAVRVAKCRVLHRLRQELGELHE